jgi:hypothetical protein
MTLFGDISVSLTTTYPDRPLDIYMHLEGLRKRDSHHFAGGYSRGMTTMASTPKIA